MLATRFFGALPLQQNDRTPYRGPHTLYRSQLRCVSEPPHRGKHVHKPWNPACGTRFAERNWELRNRDTYAVNFDVHRPLKTAFADPPYHPEWKPTALGNKLVVQSTTEFRQFAQASAWNLHRPLSRAVPKWHPDVYPRAQYVTSVGMSSSFQQ